MDPTSQRLVMGAAGAAGEKLYVEDVFSTFLYTGNGSTQTITNGIDLSGKGGLVWIKGRDFDVRHVLQDTARGTGQILSSNLTAASDFSSADITSFNVDGFTVGSNGRVNQNPAITGKGNLVSWTFRKAPKFFDVVTWTGNGSATATVNHNLGSTPGFIVYKATSATSNWFVYHRSLGTSGSLTLNTTDANPGYGRVTALSSTSFTTDATGNTNGVTYVAYLFAHDAGGFGDSGNDNVISCGQFTGSSNAASVTLGWEPQWVLVRSLDVGSSWQIYDNARGLYAPTAAGAQLNANSAGAEVPTLEAPFIGPTSFFWDGVNNFVDTGSPTYIYIAIRRGPMKTPTDATKVFNTVTVTNDSTTGANTGFPVDMLFDSRRNITGQTNVLTRLLGDKFFATSSTAAEQSSGIQIFDSSTGVKPPGIYNDSAVLQSFRRAPGFFDVVAYTGPGAGTVSHGLGVKPQLYIVKSRTGVTEWRVYAESQGATKYAKLHLTDAFMANASWLDTEPTSSVFTVSSNAAVGASGSTYIAYLFATCPGVSKVGSYTGTGTTLNVDCGFTNGARFVLIKRADSTGDWYVWDTARGIVSGNDPYLLLNSAAAEVTNTDYIDPLSSGFQISSTAPAAINANGGSFIFLAIA